ncbi:Isopentenyl-diphosphate Delta-isomerase [Gracilariopsis chorda]|uniref:Isopentenyl-diphosphate Delta-isomerase n=1 Tax=Gracilariopsis chorda TaxID=448386 RepID=A0A2V3J582_9FLOR|nr:Isopentenyl-diphosphate Delta-isomerase [Gracilariopsis chorda]|eukprot:PXF49473.1 Isopentenyl-diphosphate Delta-isomerase [Gracilariopsis chorda]
MSSASNNPVIEHSGSKSADQLDEQFDVVNESNEPVSVASRRDCHQKGLLHRSTHILLFRRSENANNQQGSPPEVLLQRRSLEKKVGAGLWDLSVAEHLSVGEDFATATVRGLEEELNLNFDKTMLVSVREPYLSRQRYAEAGVTDHMFTTLYAALYDEKVHGSPVVDKSEVQEVEWWSIDRIFEGADQGEKLFTRWFLIDLENIDLKALAEKICGDM